MPSRSEAMRAGVTLLVVAVGLVALTSAVTAQAPAVDPRSLIGEWTGEWTQVKQHLVTGKYVLVIERVEGDRVYGRRGGVDADTEFVGRLSGNELTFGREGHRTTLTIEGTRMWGPWEMPNRHRSITLMKK